MQLCISLLLLFSCFSARVELGDAQQLACLDEKGNEVDWFIGYKFPKIKEDSRFESGYSYAYITSKDVSQLQGAKPNDSADSIKKDDTKSSSFMSRFKNLLFRYIGMSPRRNKEAATSRSLSEPSSSLRGHNLSRWSLSDHLISDQRSALLRTLKQAYDETTNAILYNDDSGDTKVEEKDSDSETRSLSGDDRQADEDDEDDSDTASITSETGTRSTGKARKKRRQNNSSQAHAKGVLMLDEQNGTGVWVTHSVPRFPPRLNEPLKFSENAQYYGQTFMCIGFDLTKSGKQVVDHLRTMWPQVYDLRISERMYEMLPNLKDLNRKLKKRVKTNSKSVPKLGQVILTKGGQTLNLFSKSKNFGKDIYAGWIEQELGSALYVETWRRGTGTPLNSTCPANEFHTNNVKDLKYDEKATWSYSNDHSKWAISEKPEHAFVCIGDTNRMESQFKRGGGAVCIKCPACWSTFSSTILDVEPCPRRRDTHKRSTRKNL